MKGVYKINIDDKIFSQMIRTSNGIVARNWKGEIVKAWAMKEEKKREPRLEKTLTIRTTLQMEKEAGWRKIDIQLDCKSIIGSITTNNSQDCNIAKVREDIQELREVLDQCTFSFIYRIGNELCHRLANFALKLVNDVKWETNFPRWIKVLAQKDNMGNLPLL